MRADKCAISIRIEQRPTMLTCTGCVDVFYTVTGIMDCSQMQTTKRRGENQFKLWRFN